MPLPDCIDHGRRSKTGYASSGSAWARGEEGYLHRKIFKETHGYAPPVVMHICDNPRCINPAHLKAGDWDLNNKDRAAKGRSAKSREDLRKLSMDDANEIRRRWSLRKGLRDSENGVWKLSKDYGVDPKTIYRIVEGRTYV